MKLRALLAALLLAVMVVAVGCGDDDENEEGATETIDVIAISDEGFQVDLGKSGPSHGDLAVFDSDLEFADGGGEAGRLYGVQTSVDVTEGRRVQQAQITYDLPDGQIVIGGVSEGPAEGRGLVEDQEFTRPIIGGTGEYAGAGGEVTTTLTADGRYEHELRIER